MVLSETRGHTAISGRARGHMVGQDPRLLRHVGRLLILMLARDPYGARDYAAATGVMKNSVTLSVPRAMWFDQVARSACVH
jgi:hypothetical protein